MTNLPEGIYRSLDLELLAALNRIAMALEKCVDQRPLKRMIDINREQLELMRQSQTQYRGMGYKEEFQPLKFIAERIDRLQAAIEADEQEMQDIANRT